MFASMGWNCNGAIFRKNVLGLTNEGGYKTMPFDIVATPYEGLCECLLDDFSHFFDNLRMVDGVIVNYYGMWFNHESPILQDKFEKDYFVKNNFENFKVRYTARIQNFLDYIKTAIEKNSNITFFCMNPCTDFINLDEIIKNKWPKLKYIIFGCIHPDISGYSYYDHFKASVQVTEYVQTSTIYIWDKPQFPSKNLIFSFDKN